MEALLDDNWLSEVAAVITAFSEIRRLLLGRALAAADNFIAEYVGRRDEARELNRNESGDFNLLQLLGIGELQHSFLLGTLLNPSGAHGQGGLFLRTFLKALAIEWAERDTWTVTVGFGYLDICVRKSNPYSVIIIENKSNGAPDQPNQLYRYWYQWIELPRRMNPACGSDRHQDRILYLAQDKGKKPSGQTLTRPEEWPNDTPAKITQIDPIIWTFGDDVCRWLTEALDGVPRDNHRMRVFIKQYIELWRPR